MRFVEQVAYEESAKLVVQPEPEVVTRVFMLFEGVGKEEVGRRRMGRGEGASGGGGLGEGGRHQGGGEG